jgi:hypothetical protein
MKSVIYNLKQYLDNQLPAETFYVNLKLQSSTQTQIPDKMSIITDTGGVEQPVSQYTQLSVQIMSRAVDAPSAKTLSMSIYDLLHNKYGLQLPSVAVDSVIYSAVTTAQIKGLTVPQSLGVDAEGRSQWVVNYQIIYEEE